MTTIDSSPTGAAAHGDDALRSDIYGVEDEHTTETRRSFATSEFWILLVAAVALLFFAYDTGSDSFSRDDGWRYATWLTLGYLVSRGLAKAGSYESFTRDRGH